jgi:hypothetical protein
MATTSWAQTTRATITGIISSNTSSGLAGVPIQATNSENGVTVKATASADGSYTLSDLQPGKYRILASKPTGPGTLYLDYRQTVTLEPSQVLRLDIRMQPFGGNILATARERLRLPEPPAGPPPRTADGKPEIGGVWFGVVYSNWESPELLDAAAAVAEERLANRNKDHPAARCLPTGVGPQGGVFWYKLVQTPSLIVMLFEDDLRTYREIYLDGRAHPKDPSLSWLGHSVGNWDGDTLVVDTIGFNGLVWLDLPRRNTALPSTEMLHVIERYRRIDRGHLGVEITIDDPGAYRQPWTAKGTSEMAVGLDLHENICNENNKTPQR